MKKAEKTLPEIIGAEDFKALSKVLKKVMPMTNWLHEQTMVFDKQVERYSTLGHFIEQQVKLKKGKAPAAKSELVKKFDELHTTFTQLLKDYEDYADVFLPIEDKAVKLLTTLNDPKKTKQAAATIAKVDALFAPVSNEVKVFKARCKEIEPMLKECEKLRQKQLN